MRKQAIAEAFSDDFAGVAELADAVDLGSNGDSCAGSSPVARTRVRTVTLIQSVLRLRFLLFLYSFRQNGIMAYPITSQHFTGK